MADFIFDYNNPFQNPTFVKNVIPPYTVDYFLATDYHRFMGDAGSGSIIELQRQQGVGAGQYMYFPIQQIFKARMNNGFEPLAGAEYTPIATTAELKVEFFRIGVGTTQQELQELAVKFNISPALKTTLLEQARELNARRITQAFALSFPGENYIANSDIEYKDLIARIAAAPLDADGGVSRSRIIFGNDYLTTQTTVGAALTNATLPDNAGNKLTVSHIRKAVSRAKTGKSGLVTDQTFISEEAMLREAILSPINSQYFSGMPSRNYILLISPTGYQQLVQDEDWKSLAFRGVNMEDQPNFLCGSMYKGTVEGVRIMEIPEFENYVFTKDGTTYTYSALCGAGALTFGIGKDPYFEHDNRDHNIHVNISHNEISAVKALQYPSKSRGTRGNNNNLVTRGLVHSFTTVA